MISRIRLISLLVSIIVILSISRQARSQALGCFCLNNDYNPTGNGSSYTTNINFLLSTLTNASRTEEFYNSTAGLNTSGPTYGLYMCRGDVTRELCHSCIENASREILNTCPNQTLAIIWYDNCMLRYSNRSIISLPDWGFIFLTMCNPFNVTTGELAGFNQALAKMMDEIATRAAKNSGSGKKFATQDGNYSLFGKLYTLAQCTPDISTDDCDTCLREAIKIIPGYCGGKWGGRILYPSCNIRFETYKFYTIPDNALSQAPMPPDVAINSTDPPASITFTNDKGKSISVAVVIAIVVSIIVSIVLFVLAFLVLKKRSKETYGVVDNEADGNDMSLVESIQYSFSEIQAATNNFSIDHKIGEGGFGQVYKGTLPNGKDIAVKRLSRTSVQGVEEFKNEILLVAKLQHRNLVRLLGFSFQGEEKILIYEFVPNKSLDYFLFVVTCPPILEIISGKKNSNFYQLDMGEDSLLSYAWKNWRDGTPLDLVDEQLGDSNYSRDEILHYIHVGLLCVQEDVEQRPTMALAVLMLSSRSITLAAPNHPAFYAHSKTEPFWPRIDLEESDKSTTKKVPASVNETSITEPYPR